jgi:hypothetical protein
MVVGGGGVAAAAAAAKRRREILDAFRKAGATAPDRAIAESDLPHHDHALFRDLEKHAIVVRMPNGRVYLDQAAEARAGQVQLKIVVGVLAAILIALAWVLGLRKGAP